LSEYSPYSRSETFYMSLEYIHWVNRENIKLQRKLIFISFLIHMYLNRVNFMTLKIISLKTLNFAKTALNSCIYKTCVVNIISCNKVIISKRKIEGVYPLRYFLTGAIIIRVCHCISTFLKLAQ